MKKLCLIYANCQGQGLGYFLNQSPDFEKNYRVEYLYNYLMIEEKKELPAELLHQADLFIYQPIDDKHDLYSTSFVLSRLADRCQPISFPYLYNDALWPLFRNGKKVVNAEPVLELLDSGASVPEVLFRFLALKIDFKFQQRFEKSLKILQERESVTQIKAADYILKHLKTERLFLTHNHPSTPLFIHCTNQILGVLGYAHLRKADFPHLNAANLPGYFPISSYERAHYQFSYQDDWRHFYETKRESHWRRFYLLRLAEICLSRHQKKRVKYYFDKNVLKLFRSVSKCLPQ